MEHSRNLDTGGGGRTEPIPRESQDNRRRPWSPGSGDVERRPRALAPDRAAIRDSPRIREARERPRHEAHNQVLRRTMAGRWKEERTGIGHFGGVEGGLECGIGSSSQGATAPPCRQCTHAGDLAPNGIALSGRMERGVAPSAQTRPPRDDRSQPRQHRSSSVSNRHRRVARP